MKTKLAIIFIALTIASGHSQTIKPIESAHTDSEFAKNVYYKDTGNILAGMVGTWLYNDGVNYFKISFTLVPKVLDSEENDYNRYIDRLYSKYIFKKNGVTIYDTTGFLVNPLSSKIKSTYVDNDVVSFLYDEPSLTSCHRRKQGFLEISGMSGLPPRLQWTRETSTGSFLEEKCDDGSLADNSDFLIPSVMILNKVN